MNKKYDFTEQQIKSAAESSNSKTEMMRALGIRQGGGGYQALDFWCRKFNVTPPDGKSIGNKNVVTHQFLAMSNEEWFQDNTRRTGQQSRKRLVTLGIKDECSECGQGPVWSNKPLVLQLDHINGNRWDNRIENLRILCPHCHTQTSTYANTGAVKRRNYCECGAEIAKNSIFCRHCAPKNKIKKPKIDWPSVDEVVKQVRLTNFSHYAKILGVSDNAVRKFLERNGIDSKTLLPLVV